MEEENKKSHKERSNLIKRDIAELIKVKGARKSTIENKLYFLECLQQTKGVVTAVCMRTNISRATYYHWIKTDRNFKEAVESIKSEKAEILEDRLFTLALDGDIGALRYLHSFYAHSRKEKPETSVHIYHHTNKADPKDNTKTFEDVVDEILKQLDEKNEDAEG